MIFIGGTKMAKILVIIFMIFFFGLQSSQAKDYTPTNCPVVGNTNSYIYHVPGGSHYAKMLRQNRYSDNRKCFKTEQEAENAGYRKSKN